MNTSCRVEDDALGNALAGLLDHLRRPPHGQPHARPESVLRREADEFVGRLAEHLCYTEEVLFPALQELESCSDDLREFEADHRLLHLCARDLARRVLTRELGAAYRGSREFLALLLDHLRRENACVGRRVNTLDASEVRRLLQDLIQWRATGGDPISSSW